jgi:hypothetical protein
MDKQTQPKALGDQASPALDRTTAFQVGTESADRFGLGPRDQVRRLPHGGANREGWSSPDLGIPIPSKRGALLGGEATHVHHNLRPMTIFDDFSQRKTDPRPDGEAEFACLNRSGRPDGWRVRQLVDESLAHYPVEHRDILATRFSLRQR